MTSDNKGPPARSEFDDVEPDTILHDAMTMMRLGAHGVSEALATNKPDEQLAPVGGGRLRCWNMRWLASLLGGAAAHAEGDA